jgi:hypothetical protein
MMFPPPLIMEKRGDPGIIGNTAMQPLGIMPGVATPVLAGQQSKLRRAHLHRHSGLSTRMVFWCGRFILRAFVQPLLPSAGVDCKVQ